MGKRPEDERKNLSNQPVQQRLGGGRKSNRVHVRLRVVEGGSDFPLLNKASNTGHLPAIFHQYPPHQTIRDAPDERKTTQQQQQQQQNEFTLKLRDDDSFPLLTTR